MSTLKVKIGWLTCDTGTHMLVKTFCWLGLDLACFKPLSLYGTHLSQLWTCRLQKAHHALITRVVKNLMKIELLLNLQYKTINRMRFADNVQAQKVLWLNSFPPQIVLYHHYLNYIHISYSSSTCVKSRFWKTCRLIFFHSFIFGFTDINIVKVSWDFSPG